MYTNETPNYKLPQFIDVDKMDLVADFDPAFATIDNQLEQNRVTAQDALDGVTGAQADAQAAQESAQKAENAAVSAAKSASDAADDADTALQKVANLENEVEQLQDAQTAQGTQVDSLSNEFHEFQRHQTALNTSQDNINKNLTETDTRLEGDIEALDTRVTKNEEDIQAMQESTTADKAELQQQITANKGDIDGIKATVADHSNTLGTLTETVEHQGNDIETLQTAVNAIPGSYATKDYVAGQIGDLTIPDGSLPSAPTDFPYTAKDATDLVLTSISMAVKSGIELSDIIATMWDGKNNTYPPTDLPETKSLKGLDERVAALESGSGGSFATEEYVNNKIGSLYMDMTNLPDQPAGPDFQANNATEFTLGAAGLAYYQTGDNSNEIQKIWNGGSSMPPETVSEENSIVGLQSRVSSLEGEIKHIEIIDRNPISPATDTIPLGLPSNKKVKYCDVSLTIEFSASSKSYNAIIGTRLFAVDVSNTALVYGGISIKCNPNAENMAVIYAQNSTMFGIVPGVVVRCDSNTNISHINGSITSYYDRD